MIIEVQLKINHQNNAHIEFDYKYDQASGSKTKKNILAQ